MVLSETQESHHITLSVDHLQLVKATQSVRKSAEDILRAADRAEPELRRATLAAYTELQKQLPNLEALIQAGDTAAVMDAIRTVQVPPKMVNRIVDATVTAAVASGMPEAARFALSFNAPNEEVIRWAKLNAAKNITSGGVDLATQAAIRDVMVNALETGVNPKVTGNILKGMVPLDGHQSKLIRNWVKGATDAGLAQSHIDKVVARKTARGKRYRAIRIARTETIKAANMGQQAVWTAAKDAGLIPAGTKKVWVASGDDRTCPICAVLNGKPVEVSGNFRVHEQATGFTRVGSTKEVTEATFRVSGTKPLKKPSSPKVPPAHPQCRCTLVLETIPAPRRQASPEVRSPDISASQSAVFSDSADLMRTEQKAWQTRWLHSAPNPAERQYREDLIDGVESWTGSDWGRVRREVRRSIKSGKPPKNAGDRALYQALDGLEPDAPTLARGESIPRTQTARLEWLSSTLEEGAEWDMDLASFSTKLDAAADWAPAAPDQVSVIWRVRPGSRALNVEFASRKPNEHEWLSVGRYRTVSAEKMPGLEAQGLERWVIEVEQVAGVAKRIGWIPADWNPLAASSYLFRSFADRKPGR